MSESDATLRPVPAEEILEEMTDGFMRLDPAWRITYVNAAAEKTNELTREALLGRIFWDAFPAVPGTDVERALRQAMSDRVPVHAEHFYEPYGRWFEAVIQPLRDGGLAFFGRDITDRRLEEERQRLYGLVARKAAELAQSESQLSEAQQLAHIGSWNWDLATNLLSWSDEHYRIFGLERDGSPMTFERGITVIHPEDLPRVQRTVDEALRERTPYECCLRLLRPDGSIRFVHSRGQAVYDEAGKPVRMYGTVQDVTERRRAEEAREVLAAIVESSGDAIISKDLDGTITSWNDSARRIFGYDAGEVIGLPVAVLIPAELAAEEAYILARLRRGERVEPFETVRVAKGGRRVDVSLTISPVRDADGRVVGASKVARDITDRKRAEEALRVAKEQLDLAIRGSNIGIWDLDLPTGGDYRNGPVRFVNKWEQLGYDPAEFPTDASASRALGHPDDLVRVDAAVAACLAGETDEINVENRIRHKDGSYVWLLTLGKVLRDASGKPVRLIGTCLSITERKRREAELRQAKEAAEDANRVKDEFLATLSHELRTPLAGIMLWARLLADGLVDDGHKPKALRAILSAAEAQNQLIGDLLDVSGMMAGKLRLDLRQVELAAVVRAAVDAVRPTAAAKGVRLVTREEGVFAGAALFVRADSIRLQQVFWNLLTNAVKFTPPDGTVEVRLDSFGALARVTVSDTGRGIAADFLPYVFDRFRQAESGITRNYGGLGLGLAIVRDLVQLHGGSVHAYSAGEGRGATFTVELPLVQRGADPVAAGAAAGGVAGAGQEKPLAGLRLLLVEDDPVVREGLARVLETSGAQVTSVETSAEALEVLARGTTEVLVSDIGLREDDGYTLIRKVHAAAAERGDPPVPALALTAYAGPEDRERALAAGFKAYASKPVMPLELIRAVATLSGRTV